MTNDEIILELIKKHIEGKEKPGHQSGGSGHMGYVSFVIDNFKTESLPDWKTQVKYRYTKYIETEFTYEPDNPPMSYPSEGNFIFDSKYNIVTED